ncbi:olfactory receptor 6E1-like [Ictidomys tridecemlineatus]
MDGSNLTRVTEFILLGFQNENPVNILLFSVFLLIYLTSLVGNTLIILLVCCDRRLHSPMYFFVANLSFLEVAITSTVVPEMLANTFSLTKAISFVGCLMQSFFYFLLGSTEFFLLAVMSFDGYVAICNPLRYTLIMNRQTLGVAPGVLRGRLSVHPGAVSFNLPPALLRAQRGEPLLLRQRPGAEAGLRGHLSGGAGGLRLLGGAAPGLPAPDRRVLHLHHHHSGQDALGAGPAQGLLHLRLAHHGGNAVLGQLHLHLCAPAEGRRDGRKQVRHLLNTIVTPMLNPFVYSLRNEKVKGSLRDSLAKCPSSLGTSMCPR